VTLLSAVNDAQRLLSLAVTTAIVADGQETQNLLLALAKMEANEILERDEYDFPTLTRTQSFTASLASLQSAPGKPSDFHRAIPETFWNRTTDRKIGGPLNAKEWALAHGMPITSTIEQYVMFRYDGLHIYPVPTAADTIAFDYIFNTPVQATGAGAYKTNFTVDTDVYLLGDRILTLALIWRYKHAKGRDYAEDMKTYEMALAALVRKDKGAARELNIAPPEWIIGRLTAICLRRGTARETRARAKAAAAHGHAAASSGARGVPGRSGAGLGYRNPDRRTAAKPHRRAIRQLHPDRRVRIAPRGLFRARHRHRLSRRNADALRLRDRSAAVRSGRDGDL
jgi:hypothetical protein